ncbi:hypothetical protein LOH54_10700 [Sulfurimonas sp. HSL-3221]|uniref:hypothetical protein n=1 Tax=Sulfurimonadaceae TaxID=2771471 RepID=UPI001E2B058F|nr:hypothetical protein [Sulfurimonas sp. HSL-3221]UFS62116.1 hypothetical protein LOH54_10700 [Sulfurimonas sp. HSL-3221]
MFVITLGVLACGCSNEMRYDMAHDIAKQNCRNITSPDERRACEGQHDQPYQEYKAAEQYPVGQ